MNDVTDAEWYYYHTPLDTDEEDERIENEIADRAIAYGDWLNEQEEK